jgi:hypothetical protein
MVIAQKKKIGFLVGFSKKRKIRVQNNYNREKGTCAKFQPLKKKSNESAKPKKKNLLLLFPFSNPSLFVLRIFLLSSPFLH